MHKNLTHLQENESIEQIKTPLAHPEHREIVDGLAQFPLGRFLLLHEGLNGYWTQYIISHPEHPKGGLSRYEKLVLEQLPISLATQERYQIFRRLLQAEVREGVRLASVPCGLMGELLTLDYSEVEHYTLCGVDLDEESIESARAWSKKLEMEGHCAFACADAWNFEGSCDAIASNGLNIYLSDEERLIALYRTFYEALMEGGVLITSYLTPPPVWDLEKISLEMLQFQKTLFQEILRPKFQNFLPEEQVIAQLQEAGFREVEVFYDRGRLFPAYKASKRCSS